ncbi:MAG: aryl-sulfate sulfotransferase [Chloroflexi bacterium]|nr:aryl-sulfate sulfotransferase [Chloroflexota bacterium]
MIRTLRIVSLLAMLMVVTGSVLAQGGGQNASPFSAPDPNRPTGLLTNTGEAEDGYVLVSMVQSKDTLLLSNDGRVVNIWPGDYYPSNSAYLLDNGHLQRAVSLENTFGFAPNGQWGFIGGRIEELNWDGEVVWSFEFASEDHVTHHDIEPMPNGHILFLAFERLTREDAIAEGFNPEFFAEDRDEIWSEAVYEVDPATNEIVWEWHLWDHFIQDFDENAENFGVVADHPEKVNINFKDPDESLAPNWWHVNAVAYNAELDQIVLSPRRYSEIWIIDHSISTGEAAGEAGDLLYRWGNPQTYNTGTAEDRQLYYQHDPRWIREGRPGEGNITIFDNGGAPRPYSRVVEMKPPVGEDGHYIMEVGQPTGPTELEWEYVAETPENFFSSLISGAERQPNGNTIIDEGLRGHIFEVTSDGEIVWEYNLPPAAWAFRAERYNLPVFGELDMTSDLEFTGGVLWGVDCNDGTQPRLHEYLPQEESAMRLFIETHGDDAQTAWETEACAEHDDRAGIDE